LIEIIEGNLLEAKENIIGHQVNCQAVMGSGVALQIRRKHPEVYEEYLKAFKEVESKDLLGHCQLVDISTPDEQFKFAANLFGQLNFGSDGTQYTNVEALRNALYALSQIALDNNLTVALPYKIGSDRGGADWNEVYQMLEEVFTNQKLTLYKFCP
jgi:O-acetyl-ADP-ribose deacetylase (regulator of RNase III)